MEISWLIFLAIFTISLFKFLLKKTPTSNLPPGPPKLPLIGNLHQLAKGNILPHRRFAQLAAVHGPIMHLKLGEISTVVMSTAEMAREVMKTHDAVFCNRPSLRVGKELFYEFTDIGLAPFGEYWRQVRKISAFELFTTKRVESFRPIREEEVAELMESLRLEAGSTINLSKKLFGLTFNISSRVTFNKKGKGREEFHALIAGIVEAASGFSIADVYPSFGTLLHSISGMKKKFKKLVEQTNRILDPIIEEHMTKKKDRGNNDNDDYNEDLVDVLLKFHKDNAQPTQEFSLSTDNVKAVLLEVFGAGSETSSTVMEWAMSELLKNPKAMEKVQSEVRQAYQEKGTVDETTVHELKYLKHVIRETLRLHPPVPLLVPRQSMERCQISSYDLPPKTRVIINAWAIARDPKFWPEPEKFNPNRFEECSINYKGNTNFELIPFGGGRRRCPGMTLGIANVELPLAMLLYHFDWKLPRGVESPESLDLDESYGITMRRKNDLYVIPIPYPNQ
ncbi:desmethyl-deoxy-podophyllotoxin synthase-like [Spinacia oleracea]|uniref:Desmethyl-deoxy-podophyllotoxin synthase-like n=1 Tax=Spinacia oleracea TaxID=3562 RepID=A0A9R0K801_SPIOL|nr:desmethyl-deoxy-podophyllotoxin synthase-like [Spinacia oleracea]